MEYRIQVNGRCVGSISFSNPYNKLEIEKVMLENTKKYTLLPVKKIIVIENRLINYII
jgi:hypothetical protein